MKTDRIFDRNESRVGTVNRQTDQATVDVVRRLGQQVLSPGSQIKMPQANHSGLYVPFSRNNGFTHADDKSSIVCAPGTTFNRQITITGTVILSHCFIDCFNNEPGIVVKDGGRLILRAAHVTKADNQHAVATDTYIKVESGGYLSVSDSIFYGNQSNTGHIIYNYNVHNTTVAVLGSANLTDINSPFHHVHYIQVIP